MTGEAAPATSAAPAGAQAAALAVADLSHSFGSRKALVNVSFEIPAGSFTVLLGPNGAGKTTLFSLVTRLYNSRIGSIRIYGYEVRRQPAAALSRIGAIFQQRTLDLDLTVADNLRYHAALHGMMPREARERITTELARAGLLERLSDRVRSLSGGQMRRVEIAGALLHRPRLLLLDEPTVGVDIASRQAIVDHVHGLCQEDGLGVLWATHLVDEVRPGDQVIIL
ncbi:MAG: ATP-binding cassette domain-containing protein, partial [Dongiaceae bacterium]